MDSIQIINAITIILILELNKFYSQRYFHEIYEPARVWGASRSKKGNQIWMQTSLELQTLVSKIIHAL